VFLKAFTKCGQFTLDDVVQWITFLGWCNPNAQKKVCLRFDSSIECSGRSVWGILFLTSEQAGAVEKNSCCKVLREAEACLEVGCFLHVRRLAPERTIVETSVDASSV
jgi:hypothetical protein